MKKILVRILQIIIALYFILCAGMYFMQEKMIFFPEKLPADHVFSFDEEFEEIEITVEDDAVLNGLLFRADSSRGLVFYLHGNGGSINSWGEIAGTFTNLNYDLFLLDYRSYGKSTGKIRSQRQLFTDMQTAYEEMTTLYHEEDIVLLGYSLGTGFAAKLAAENNPKQLILQAPYFSILDIVRNQYPFIPTSLLKYKLKTNEFIPDCQMPIAFIHGDVDEMIPMEASVRLKKLAKDSDVLITLPGQGHNGMTGNPDYISAISSLLK